MTFVTVLRVLNESWEKGQSNREKWIAHSLRLKEAPVIYFGNKLICRTSPVWQSLDRQTGVWRIHHNSRLRHGGNRSILRMLNESLAAVFPASGEWLVLPRCARSRRAPQARLCFSRKPRYGSFGKSTGATHMTLSLPIYRNQPQRLGSDRTPAKAENGGRWTDSFVQDFDWLSISIEPDRLIRGIIDHKPNSFSERDDPLRKAIEHPPHKTHRPLS